MEAVYFGTWNATRSGWCGGAGQGPWIMADLEDGLWACDKRHAVNPTTTPATSDFVTGVLRGGSDAWGLKVGDAAAGPLATQWEGPRPSGYSPMKKQGSIILGIGGDNSDSALGVWLEGLMTNGVAADAADDAVQADIVAAGLRL